jgi:threonine/homoserine/homoserine lactone efflux protein
VSPFLARAARSRGRGSLTLETVFLAGVAAGLGVAVPFGAIAILIVETGIRHGRAYAWAAGAGAATADLTYSTLAALFGTALARLIAPVQVPLRWVSVAVLAVIAARGIATAIARARATPGDPHLERLDESSPRRTYLQFVALTLSNPATVIYFAALVLGLPSLGSDPAAKVAFVAGVVLASFVWQVILGTVGSLLHHRISVRPIAALSLGGYGIILLIAANIAWHLVSR